MAQAMIMSRGTFQSLQLIYTGSYVYKREAGGKWNVKFLTSGTLTLLEDAMIDAFLCGGGSGGGAWSSLTGGPAGGGGYTYNRKNFTLYRGVPYPIVIGNGGAGAYATAVNPGQATTAFGHTANGASGQTGLGGGHGGSGGSGGGANTTTSRSGGVDGGNGQSGGEYPGGTGQGSTTRAFAEVSYPLFSNGGSFVYGEQQGQSKPPNTGDGGNAGMSLPGGNGGSGIVWIRSAR